MTKNKQQVKYTHSSEWFFYFMNHLIKCQEQETVIIKGLILLEHAIDSFIERSNPNASETNFTFSQKLKIFEIFAKPDKVLLMDIKLLNELRNKYAHKLEVDEKLLKQFHAIKTAPESWYIESKIAYKDPLIKTILGIVFLMGRVTKVVEGCFGKEINLKFEKFR